MHPQVAAQRIPIWQPDASADGHLTHLQMASFHNLESCLQRCYEMEFLVLGRSRTLSVQIYLTYVQ